MRAYTRVSVRALARAHLAAINTAAAGSAYKYATRVRPSGIRVCRACKVRRTRPTARTRWNAMNVDDDT